MTTNLATKKNKVIVVLSDLHLGPGKKVPHLESFSDDAGAALTSFLTWLDVESPWRNHAIELVIAGDFIDFLVVPNNIEPSQLFFSPIWRDAKNKLQQVFENHDNVFQALQNFLNSLRDRRITILAGNHDIELFHPEVREALHYRLGREPRLNIITTVDSNGYLSYKYGNLYIDHGNQFDVPNRFSDISIFENLSEVQARDEEPLDYSGLIPPGSNIVYHGWDKIKQHYAFIDSIKPPQKGLILALAVAPEAFDVIWSALDARLVGAIKTMILNEIKTSAEDKFQEAKDNVENWFGSLRDKFSRKEAPQPGLSAKNWGSDFGAHVSSFFRSTFMADILTPMVINIIQYQQDWRNQGSPLEEYMMKPVGKLADKFAYEHVIMGHTHTAGKRKIGKSNQSLYLNTGTWTPLLDLTGFDVKADSPGFPILRSRLGLSTAKGASDQAKYIVNYTAAIAVFDSNKTTLECDIYDWDHLRSEPKLRLYDPRITRDIVF